MSEFCVLMKRGFVAILAVLQEIGTKSEHKICTKRRSFIFYISFSYGLRDHSALVAESRISYNRILSLKSLGAHESLSTIPEKHL